MNYRTRYGDWALVLEASEELSRAMRTGFRAAMADHGSP